MNQKFSYSMFAGGLSTFLGLSTEMLSQHNEWAYLYSTPLGFVHALILGVAFAVTILGALGIQLPRSDTHADRKTDQVISAETPAGTTTTVVTKTTEPAPAPALEKQP